MNREINKIFSMPVKISDFRISPNFKSSKWNELDLRAKDSLDWKVAVDIFEDRIEGRFLKQIEILANKSDRKIREFSGFAIMALDCLLIETLQQFHRGSKRTGKDQDDVMFHDFFQRAPEFSTYFDTLAKSNVFYNQIRCGILHQAQTKKKSAIHIRYGSPLASWVDIVDPSQGISINRLLFHKAVLGVYASYIAQLRGNNHLNLRRKFEKKMNMIASQS
jgi:hypothetical protein